MSKQDFSPTEIVPPPYTPLDKILRRPAVSEITGLSRSTLHDYVRKGIFPVPVKLGPRNVGWKASQVSAWINSRHPKG
ncbi:MAG: AlpA family phage regulatory protein [Magnetococcales bacterium]|nr:AlpA family phage regulatory protein [Magnetococcales bacterium]